EVTDIGLESQQVEQPAARYVRQPVHVHAGVQQVEHGADVDLRGLEQHVADAATCKLGRALVQVGQRPACQRVAVRVDAARGKADHGVARLDARARDDRV